MIKPAEYDNPIDIQSAIIAARPRIEQVNRIAGWATAIFGVFNFLFGLALIFGIARFSEGISLLVLFGAVFWGIVFCSSGVIICTAWLLNNWRVMRLMLLLMFILKIIWMMSLIYRLIFTDYSNYLTVLVWSALAALQFCVYLFFFPEVPAAERRLHGDKNVN